jgi:hypothetical protein
MIINIIIIKIKNDIFLSAVHLLQLCLDNNYRGLPQEYPHHLPG